MVSEEFKARMRAPNVHTFLYKLYAIGRVKKVKVSANTDRERRKVIIEAATANQIDVLITLIRLLVVEEITVHTDRLPELNKSTKTTGVLKRYFNTTSGYELLKKKSLKDQKRILMDIVAYHQLLYLVFNKTKD